MKPKHKLLVLTIIFIIVSITFNGYQAAKLQEKNAGIENAPAFGSDSKSAYSNHLEVEAKDGTGIFQIDSDLKISDADDIARGSRTEQIEKYNKAAYNGWTFGKGINSDPCVTGTFSYEELKTAGLKITTPDGTTKSLQGMVLDPEKMTVTGIGNDGFSGIHFEAVKGLNSLGNYDHSNKWDKEPLVLSNAKLHNTVNINNPDIFYKITLWVN